MNAIHERSILGEIECHELSREYKTARFLKKRFKNEKKRNKNSKKNYSFEGTIVAAGWDKDEHVTKSSLYTQDDEDILLEHQLGIDKLKPYLNQKVKVIGDIISTVRDGRKVIVKKISRLDHGFTKQIIPPIDELNNLLISADIRK